MILITTVCFLFWNYWNIAEITIKKAKSSPCSQSFSSKQKTSASVPKSPHLFNSSSTATAQKPLPPIRHICGLGASVGCERMERTFNAPRLKSQICLIGGNGFVCSSLNELNSNPLTFCSILFIVRILIRLTEVSGMNHMKYKTLIADRLGNSCLDAGFFISDKIIFYPISLIRSNFKSLLSHVLKKMFFQTCSKERKIKL